MGRRLSDAQRKAIFAKLNAERSGSVRRNIGQGAAVGAAGFGLGRAAGRGGGRAAIAAIAISAAIKGIREHRRRKSDRTKFNSSFKRNLKRSRSKIRINPKSAHRPEVQFAAGRIAARGASERTLDSFKPTSRQGKNIQAGFFDPEKREKRLQTASTITSLRGLSPQHRRNLPSLSGLVIRQTTHKKGDRGELGRRRKFRRFKRLGSGT